MASVSSKMDSSDRASQCWSLIQMGKVEEIDEESHRSEKVFQCPCAPGWRRGGPFGKELIGLTDGVKGTARGPHGDR